MKTPLAIFFGVLFYLLGCVQDAWAEEVTDDPVRNGVHQSQLLMHPVRTVAYWRPADQKPTRQIRVGPAPPELIDFIRLDNVFKGYSEKPVPANKDSQFIRDVEAAMDSLPRSVRRIAEKRLFYIALVRDLGGGTGYMDAVANADGSAAGGFIVLDEGALDQTANGWVSWREGSAFRPAADLNIEVHIEAPKNDTRVNAIRYILLHELGHVIDVVLGVTPTGGGDPQNIADNGFYKLSWMDPSSPQTGPLPGDTLHSRFDADWPDRALLAFYAFDASRFDITGAPAIYGWLRETNFPTLYAATSPADDFAESFVNYVHVVLDKRPFEVRLRTGQQSEFLFGSCWDSPLCASKKAVMQRLLLRAEILH